MKLTERINRLRDSLLTGLVERDVPIRLALLAALTGEHLLLVGPPGTAKSMVARRLKCAFGRVPYFERLLTRFTVPEEIFGPLSVKALEEDRYERLVESYLPSASVAFLDEIFKANSAILNSLLTLLNEREFDNGTTRSKTPLLAVVGASNELPGETELDALYDRFLLRVHVGPVSEDGFDALLDTNGEAEPEVGEEIQFTAEDLKRLQVEAQETVIPENIRTLLGELRTFCAEQEIQVSDRRWRKVVKLLQMSAHTNGRSKIDIWDCWLLQHCLWNSPEQRQAIYDWYVVRVSAAGALDSAKISTVLSAWEKQLKRDRDHRSQATDDAGCGLFADIDGNPTTENTGDVQAQRGKQKLFLAPEGAYEESASYYSSSRARVSRDNDGKGFTLAQLDELHTPERIEFRKWANRGDYLKTPENWMLEEGDLPPLMEPTRHKPAHIERCLNELSSIASDLELLHSELANNLNALKKTINNHLWTPDSFTEPAAVAIKSAIQTTEALNGRLVGLREGYRSLPVEKLELPTAA